MLTTMQKIALARAVQKPVVAARSLASLGAITTVRRRRVSWTLDLREGIDFSIWLLGAFELATVRAYERLVRPGDTVLDIGANIGAHTLHLARAVGAQGKVYAIEPTDYAIGKLKANIALKPGGAYSMKLNSKSVAFVVDADAVAGTGPVMSRLVSLR